MTLSEELTWRGFVNQMTFADIKELDETPRTFYWGVDPSADSMTIGNLAAAMMVRHFIDHGYAPILLVGGATGMIGDPDGKKQERDLKTNDELNKNIEGITAQYHKIFDGKPFEIVNNYDWFKDMGYMQFLRDVGKHVSLTQMLDRDFVQARIGEGGSGISYAEFSYALIQGYDFLHLYRDKNCTLQVAGADQWGNSISGVSLIRRLEGAEAHVYTAPLIVNKTTGVKFGKSEDGAIWLDPAKTSPYKFYQFWLNVDDETAKDLIKIYTLLDKESVDNLIAKHEQAPHLRELQETLAYEVTTLVHGEERAFLVQQATEILFGKNSLNVFDNMRSLSSAILDTLENELPTVRIKQSTTLEDALSGNSVVYILKKSGVVMSFNEATRLINAGAISLNGEKITTDCAVVAPSLIRKGKNSFVLVR